MNQIDQNLVISFLQGDSNSLAEIYNKAADKVYKYIYVKVGNKQWAQDILSDTFITFISIASKYNGNSKLETFIIGIANNKILQFIAKESKYKNVEDFFFVGDLNDTSYSEDNHQTSIEKENTLLISKIEQHLPAKYFNVLKERFINERSVQETAKILEQSPENIRVMTHRALKKAGQIIQDIK